MDKHEFAQRIGEEIKRRKAEKQKNEKKREIDVGEYLYSRSGRIAKEKFRHRR